MIIKQAELKSASVKALVSQDKSVRLIFDVNLTEANLVDINKLHDFLYKSLILEIKEDGEYDSA
jgi:hypothetical protein